MKKYGSLLIKFNKESKMNDFQKRLQLINSITILIIICLISMLTITLFSCKLPSVPEDSKGPDSINVGPDESDLNTIKGSGNIKSIEIIRRLRT